MPFKFDRLIAHKTWEIQLQMDFAFSFEMWQSLCVCESENTKDNARFAIAIAKSQFMRPHVENAIEKQFAIPFEKSPDYSSI